MKRLAILFVLLLVVQASAEDVRLDWVDQGFSGKLGFYRPRRVDLSPTKPARVTRMPENVSNPLFGTVSFGSREAPVVVTVLLDEPDTGAARLWIDTDGNGDLTDDPPVQWFARQSTGKSGPTTTWHGNATIPINYGNERRTLAINLYRFDKNTPLGQKQKNSLFYYLDSGFSGNISLDGKTYKAALVDDTGRGDFSGDANAARSGASLVIDLNDNGKFDLHSESFDANKPFNIGGITYEITGLTPPGGSFQLVKSSRTVAETPVLPAMDTGTKPIAFEDVSTTGQPIRFPSNYRGKLVMIDFWATWCGPCRGEIPNLVNVYDEFHSRGFEVIGVSLDNEKTRSKLASFIADNHMSWPQICDGRGWEAKLAQQYGVHGIPAAWLIDGTTGLIVAEGNDLRGTRLRPTIQRCLENLGKSPGRTSVASSQTPANAATSSGPQIIRSSADVKKLNQPVPSRIVPDDPLVAKVRALAKAGKLLTPAAFDSLLNSPKPAPIPVATVDNDGLKSIRPASAADSDSDQGLVIADPGLKSLRSLTGAGFGAGFGAGNQPLRGREIADRAARAYVRAGWIYHCSRCDGWHVRIAGGYAIASNTIVTAWHVMQTPDTIKQGEGYPVVIRGNDEFLPVVSVLAADERIDTVILRVATANLSPLALSANAQIGDAAYCYSDPRGVRGYFSNGMINRFYARPGGSANNPADQRFNVSTDWAPGSSGAAILDDTAHVIGHVTRIKPLFGGNASDDSDDHAQSATLMTLHEGVPASCVLKLIETTNRAALRPQTIASAANTPPPVPTAETKLESSTTPPAPAEPNLQLQGILSDGKSREAMINGVSVKEGDDVEGARVVSIDKKQGVKLQFQGREIVLQSQ
jgi:thiol-disulfide isomerase/thioredoxin